MIQRIDNHAVDGKEIVLMDIVNANIITMEIHAKKVVHMDV